MATERATRNRLVGFRVTADEHDSLCRYAFDDGRTLTGMLRKMLSEMDAGFGAPKRERRAEGKDTSR